MDKLEKSLIAATLINTIFHEYNSGELNSSGEIVRHRIARLMRQRAKTNKKLFLEVIKKTDIVWKDAINHFAKEKMKIEAKTTIMAFYNYFNMELERFANITDKHIEKMMINSVSDVEAEHNSDIVVDYIVQKLGIEKKRSAFGGKFLTLKNNMIIEGKKVDERFMK